MCVFYKVVKSVQRPGPDEEWIYVDRAEASKKFDELSAQASDAFIELLGPYTPGEETSMNRKTLLSLNQVFSHRAGRVKSH